MINFAVSSFTSSSKIGSAEDKAREIIDEAVKTAETKKRESLLEIKEESIRTKNELDKEIKERRNEIQRNERRVEQKESNLDKKLEAIEKREAGFAAKEEELNKQKAEITKLHEERVRALSSALPIFEAVCFFWYAFATNQVIAHVTINVITTAIITACTGAPPLFNFHCSYNINIHSSVINNNK